MLYLVLLVSVVSLASAEETCCAPMKWSGIESMVVSTLPIGKLVPTLTEGYFQLSIDYGRQLSSVIGVSTTDGASVNVTSLIDNANMKQYSVVGGKCSVTVPERPQFRCFPDQHTNATLRGSGSLGVGAGALPVKQYQYMTEGITSFLTMTDDCVPISDAYYGQTSGVYTMGNVFFTHVRDSIPDESVFIVPRECMGLSQTNPEGIIIG